MKNYCNVCVIIDWRANEQVDQIPATGQSIRNNNIGAFAIQIMDSAVGRQNLVDFPINNRIFHYNTIAFKFQLHVTGNPNNIISYQNDSSTLVNDLLNYVYSQDICTLVIFSPERKPSKHLFRTTTAMFTTTTTQGWWHTTTNYS